MSVWIRTLQIFGLLALWVSSVYANSNSSVYTHDEWLPYYHKHRLAYCFTGHRTCGQKVADQYCRDLGYDGAQRATIDHNIGLTSYLDSEKCCKGWTCNGFKLIRCYAKALHKPRGQYYYRLKEFVLPRFQHYRIDWCYQDNESCGKRAASSFCRRMGYEKATKFQPERHLAATRALGNQKLCFGDCKGFDSITCYR